MKYDVHYAERTYLESKPKDVSYYSWHRRIEEYQTRDMLYIPSKLWQLPLHESVAVVQFYGLEFYEWRYR